MKNLRYIFLRFVAAMLAPCFLALYSGCESDDGPDEPEYQWLEFYVDAHPPIDANLTSRPMAIVEGIGAMINANPMSGNRVKFDGNTSVRLESTDENVLRILSGEDFNEFLLIGVSPGSAEMDVTINGDFMESVPVVVQAWSGQE